MSKRELELQRDIVKSVQGLGGYAHKRSSRFQVGISDLLISMPTMCPIVAEVKHLGEVKRPGLRAIAITDKQTEDLNRYAASQGGKAVAFILVGAKVGQGHILWILHRASKTIDLRDLRHIVGRGPRRFYDMSKLLGYMGVPRLIPDVEDVDRLVPRYPNHVEVTTVRYEEMMRKSAKQGSI
jgi:hypothetical protein